MILILLEQWLLFFDFVREVNRKGGGKKSYEFMKMFDSIFNVLDFKEEKTPVEVKKLLAEREKARNDEDWGKADTIRDKIRKLGYLVEDSDKGPKVKKI